MEQLAYGAGLMTSSSGRKRGAVPTKPRKKPRTYGQYGLDLALNTAREVGIDLLSAEAGMRSFVAVPFNPGLAFGTFAASEIGLRTAIPKHISDNGWMDVDTRYPGTQVYPRVRNGSPLTKMAFKRRAKKRVMKKRSRYGSRMVVTRGPTYAPEKKHIDLEVVDQPIGSALGLNWSIHPFGCYPTQGTDYTNRIGRKIRIVGMEYYCEVKITAADIMRIPIGGNQVICKIWLDSDCKGAMPAVTTIEETNQAAAFPNASQLGRFRLLHQFTTDIVPTSIAGGAVDGANTTDLVKFRVPLNKVINYSGNAGTVADVVDTNIIMTMVQVKPHLAGVNPLLCTARVRYTFVDV